MRRGLTVLAVLALVLLPVHAAAALSLVQLIPVGSSPFGVAAAGGLVYVANNGGTTVSVIDTATNTVTASIDVGHGPGEIALGPGRAYVGNFNDATVSVVDTATNVRVATLSPGGLGVAVDPVLHRLYATNSARLTVFDTDTLLAVATLPAPGLTGWWAVAVDSITHRVYVGDLAGRGVTVIDGTSNTVLTTIPTGSAIRFALAVDPAASRLVVAGDTVASTVSFIDTTTNAVVRTATVGNNPSHIAFDQAHRAVITDLGSNDFAVVDPATGGVDRTALATQPAGLASSGGRFYVALRGSAAVAVLGSPAPVVDAVTISPSAPATNDVLTAAVTAHDPGGSALTYAYQWTRNGADLPGATGSTLDLSVSGNGDRGDGIAVRVTASNGTNTSAPLTSTPVTVVDSAPVVDAVLVSPAAPATGDVLTASVTAHDADGDALTYTFQWTRNGAALAGATAATLDLAVAGNGDRGDSLAVRVTVSDGMLTTASASAPVTVVDSAPVVDGVAVSPLAPATADVLTATVAAHDADGDTLTYAYQWTRNGADIAGATAAQLDLAVAGNGDHGDAIAVRVTATDGTLPSAPVSAPAIVIVDTAPVVTAVTVAPAAPATDATLVATVTASDADGDALQYAYQWTRNGSDIPGATAAALDLAVAGNGDRGDSIAVRVTASDGTLSSAPVTSAAVTVGNSAPVAQVALDSDAPATKDVLTATATASDADGDALTYQFVWKVNGVVRQTTVGASSTDVFDLRRPHNGNKGDVVTVELAVSDGTVTSALATAAATVTRSH